MGHFDRGENRGGGRDRRDGDRPQMHRATCNECGSSCEVPFKPTGSKPIFCSNCFERKGDNGAPRRDRDRRDSRRPSFDREERTMHKTDCAECGTVCEVPFEPKAGRPVFCEGCFSKQSKGGRGSGNEEIAELKQKVDALHAKVDTLMTFLGAKETKKTTTKKVASEKTEKKTPAKKVVKKAVVKKTTKKAVIKKAPAKKTIRKK